MPDFIPVSAPSFLGNEKRYVNECLDSTWISSIGAFIEELERRFSSYCEVGHAVSCCNGTVALHLALLGIGIGPGDEVLVPSLTYVASANAVRYCGAEPVFVDSDPRTWNLDPADLQRKITSRTRAVMAVHLYGKPAPMREILEIARARRIAVVEDAAEAIGASYDGRPVGALSDVAAFSFFGNKVITCGEGGMVVTGDEALARKIRQLKGQGQDFERRYWFPVVGYNYRMTNIQAALGLAQLEKIDEYLLARTEIEAWYRQEARGMPRSRLRRRRPRRAPGLLALQCRAAAARRRGARRGHGPVAPGRSGQPALLLSLSRPAALPGQPAGRLPACRVAERARAFAAYLGGNDEGAGAACRGKPRQRHGIRGRRGPELMLMEAYGEV